MTRLCEMVEVDEVDVEERASWGRSGDDEAGLGRWSSAYVDIDADGGYGLGLGDEG